MNYIGSKQSLLPFLQDVFARVRDGDERTACDLFAGTGAVGRLFKRLGLRVIANDLQYYAYVLNRAYLCIDTPPAFTALLADPDAGDGDAGMRRRGDAGAGDAGSASASTSANRTPNTEHRTPDLPSSSSNRIPEHPNTRTPNTEHRTPNTHTPTHPHTQTTQAAVDLLNALPPTEGFLSRSYGPKSGRQFYTTENAERADSIRQSLRRWKAEGTVTEDEFFYLLCALLEALDDVANTASVYGAYLKRFKASALRPLELSPLELTNHVTGCTVHNADANDLIESIECDVLYLDPPYNQRQYGANYHVLETVARYDEPELSGSTGLRAYERSRYCRRREVREAFRHLVGAAKTRHILVSYNDEGLMSLGDIQEALALRGQPAVFTRPHNRYKADNGREYRRDATLEYVHYVRVRT